MQLNDDWNAWKILAAQATTSLKSNLSSLPEWATHVDDFFATVEREMCAGTLDNHLYDEFKPWYNNVRYGMSTAIGTCAEIVAAAHVMLSDIASNCEWSTVDFVDDQQDQVIGVDLIHSRSDWKGKYTVSVKKSIIGSTPTKCTVCTDWFLRSDGEPLDVSSNRIMCVSLDGAWTLETNNINFMYNMRRSLGIHPRAYGSSTAFDVTHELVSLAKQKFPNSFTPKHFTYVAHESVL